MGYRMKFMIKLALIFFGVLFLLFLLRGRRGAEAPEGEKISIEDIHILLDALGVSVDFEEDAEEDSEYDKPPCLTYGQYMALYRQLDGEALGLPAYEGDYEPEHELLKTDWYQAYRILLAHLDTESTIWETTVFVLKVDAGKKEAFTENTAMKGSYQYCSAAFEDNVFQEMRVYVKGQTLLTIIEVLPEEHYLGNVWVMEQTDGLRECFYRQVVFQVEKDQPVEREKVDDLVFLDGTEIRTKEKDEKIHGKLLRVTEDEMEIEGWGVYPIDKDMESYRLYGSLETLRREDLKIGYEDTDFVIEKDKVCACLVVTYKEADTIRVLLKNTNKNSYYHDTVELIVDDTTIRIDADEMKTGERRSYRTKNLSDKIIINFDGITKEDNAYRGTLECFKTEDGMGLINELPLEEYLYSVVPSEMPASYPIEALKAQAVCARTYGYRYILHAGIPEVGAHVDDTVSYQVYHNCRENSASTTAVKETDGILLAYQGEPAENYYYSTSCGVGTDAAVWKTGSSKDTSYIQARKICGSVQGEESPEGIQEEAFLEGLREEENFRNFILTGQEEDLEKEEPWYRWRYAVDKLNTDILLERIQERYRISPESVLTRTEGGYYVSEPVESLGEIRELAIAKRGAGGVAEELLIASEGKTLKIISEYNIRSILCDGVSSVVRQDGSTTVPSSLLPSGFFIIEAGKRQDNVIGYTLIGGGYGHGVGMSQNGAKALGKNGFSCRQILGFFFPGCELEKVRTEE